MKKGILIAIFVLFLLSGFMGCHRGSRHVELLSRDTLIEVLADLHISESAFRLNQIGVGNQVMVRRNAYFNWVLEKHHITYQQFDTSFKFYLTDNERFSKMYDQVINKIKLRILDNKRTPKEEQVRRDSIKKDSLQKIVIQKAALRKDSIRMDSINKVNLKLAAIQKEKVKQDSIKNASQKKAAYKKEASINESLKKSLLKVKADSLKKDTAKRKKVVPPPVIKKKAPALIK
jgi:uncharacterized protein YaaW (UPF0174 family)